MKNGTNSGLGAWGTGTGESFQKLYIVRHGFVDRSKKDEKIGRYVSRAHINAIKGRSKAFILLQRVHFLFLGQSREWLSIPGNDPEVGSNPFEVK